MRSRESYYKVFQLTADIEAVKDQAVLSVNVVVETDCLSDRSAAGHELKHKAAMSEAGGVVVVIPISASHCFVW